LVVDPTDEDDGDGLADRAVGVPAFLIVGATDGDGLVDWAG